MENVLLFMTPKSMVAYLQSESTVRQVLEKMKFHRYSSVPLIDKEGKYVGTLTEGDILWYLYDKEFNDIDTEDLKVIDIPRNRDYEAVNASSNISDLFNIAINQNFVPVVDDSNAFIGIVTRKSIINYLMKKVQLLSSIK